MVSDCRIFLHGDLAHESEDRRVAQFGRLKRCCVVRWRERAKDKAQPCGVPRTLFVAASANVALQHNT